MNRSLLVLFTGVICFVTVSGHREKYKHDRRIFYKPSLNALVDKYEKMGGILDSSSRLIVLLNRKRSSILVIDTSEQVSYYLKNECHLHHRIWSNFEDYFQKLPSLEDLLKIGREKGKKSNLCTLGEPEREDVTEVFNILGGGSLTIPKRISLLANITEQLRGPLALVYQGIGSFRVDTSVDKLGQLNLAVAELLSYSDGKLGPENVSLSAAQIFKPQSGPEVLLNVLSQVGHQFDLSKIFSRLFFSPEKVESLLMKATGGYEEGFDGVIIILANYLGILNGRSNANQLVSSILNYHNPRSEAIVYKFIERTQALLSNQDERFQNAPAFSIYSSILRGISNKNSTSTNISILQIITFIISTRTTSIHPIYDVVGSLSSWYPTSIVLNSFSSVIKQFNQTLDSETTPGNSIGQVFRIGHFFAFINESTKMAVIIDHSSQLIAALNRKQSSIIVVDVSKEVKYYLKSETDTENKFWSNPRLYLRKKSSLQPFLELGQKKGKKSKLNPFEEPVLGDLRAAFESLGGSLPVSEEISRLTKLIRQLRGPLDPVYRRRPDNRFASGVDVFTKVNLAVAEVLTCSKGQGSPWELQTKTTPSLLMKHLSMFEI